MDLLIPDVHVTIRKSLDKPKRNYGRKQNVFFQPWEIIYVLDFRHQKPLWIKATVISKMGNRLNDVKTLQENIL